MFLYCVHDTMVFIIMKRTLSAKLPLAPRFLRGQSVCARRDWKIGVGVGLQGGRELILAFMRDTRNHRRLDDWALGTRVQFKL